MKKITFVFILITIFLFTGIKKSDAFSCVSLHNKYYVAYENGNVVDAFKTKIIRNLVASGTRDSCPGGRESIVELENLDLAKQALLNTFKDNNKDTGQLSDGIYKISCFSNDVKSCILYQKTGSNIDSFKIFKTIFPIKEFLGGLLKIIMIIPIMIFTLVNLALTSVFNISILYFSILILFIIFFFFGIVVFFRKVRYLGFLLILSLLIQISTFIFLFLKFISYKSYSLNKFAKPEILANNQKSLYIIGILAISLFITIIFEIGYFIYIKIKNYRERTKLANKDNLKQ